MGRTCTTTALSTRAQTPSCLYRPQHAEGSFLGGSLSPTNLEDPIQRTHHPLPHLEAAALLGLFFFFLKVFFFPSSFFISLFYLLRARSLSALHPSRRKRPWGLLRALFWSLPRKGSAA